MKLDKKDIDKWLYEKSIQLHNLNNLNNEMYASSPNRADLKNIQKEKLKFLIHQLSLDVPNDSNKSQTQVMVELKRCSTFKKYTSNNQATKSAMSLFNEHHWILFQNFIRKEYEDKRIYAASRVRKFDIFCKVRKI